MAAERRLTHFPILPDPPSSDEEWSQDIQQAFLRICNTYDHATCILRQEDHDPLRLHIVSEHILNQSVKLLEAIDQEISNLDWSDAAAKALAATIVELERAASMASSNSS